MTPHEHWASHSHAPTSFFSSRRVTVSSANRWPVRSLVAGIALAILSGCATVPIYGNAVYCKVEQPIGWSSTDDTRTIKEVKAHNAVYDRLCGKGARPE